MHKLQADFKIVTPIFMSGANQDDVELRPPSIKGVLRFWWRALAYSKFDNKMEDLHKEEEKLFGSTRQASSIVIRVSVGAMQNTNTNVIHDGFKTDKNNLGRAGARYLGYGLMATFGNEAGKLQRPCVNTAKYFKVLIISKDEIPEEVIVAVKLTGLLGGLGSRSRKGFGSLTLTALSLNSEGIWTHPSNINSYKKSLIELLGTACLTKNQPTFSAFSQLTRVDFLLSGNHPLDLLDLFGRQMQRYRSWGHNKTVNNENSEGNFDDDHDWFKNVEKFRIKNKDFHPRRIIFGLPHNYFSSKDKQSENVIGSKHDRRASPLFVHVHECSPKEYVLITLILRSEFLSCVEKIMAGSGEVPQKIDWQVIDDFLDGFRGPKDNKTKDPYFPKKQTWFGQRYHD